MLVGVLVRLRRGAVDSLKKLVVAQQIWFRILWVLRFRSSGLGFVREWASGFTLGAWSVGFRG